MALPLAAALAGLLAAWLLLAACSTARQRDEPGNLLGSLRFRDDETLEFFQSVYRSGNLYRDFRPVMVVDTIYEDMHYRELFLRTLRERFLIPPEAAERMRAQQAEDYRNRMDFLLFIYGGSNDKVNLHKPDAAWRIFLRDDDGELIAPAKVERVGEKNPIFTFLEQYFVGLDRWAEVVRVSFPKLDKAILDKPPGKHPVQLLVTGIPGTVTLAWADPGIFYQKTEQNGARPDPGKEAEPKKES